MYDTKLRKMLLENNVRQLNICIILYFLADKEQGLPQ